MTPVRGADPISAGSRSVASARWAASSAELTRLLKVGTPAGGTGAIRFPAGASVQAEVPGTGRWRPSPGGGSVEQLEKRQPPFRVDKRHHRVAIHACVRERGVDLAGRIPHPQ
ncbi:hypothetical protein SAMN05216276_101872 [Streptosporangium subroseum]|uniref:Uncharacterized protein n=1 Tax=Streptosporangium subroseum TaxID=106412 RepID=A0A239I215_9ACTN|nr:hypothetical protein SAMN05216276_101872 [Streptosporangium subroseum]